MRSSLKLIVTFVLAMSTASCGFELRGTTNTTSLAHISPLFIAGLSPTDALYRAIRNYMRTADVELVNNKESAREVLTIYDRKREKKVHSVGGRGKVLEYELLDGFSYFLGPRPKQVEVDTPNRVNVRRIYTNPETEVLGRQHEEEQLRRDMYQQMAERMIRHLSKQVN